MKVQEFYDQQWKSSGRDIFSQAFTEAIQQSSSFLGELKGGKLLEIGCGSGEQACHFARAGAEVTIIDISAESLKAAQQLAQQQGVVLIAALMDAEQLGFPADNFDFIYINSTLMHVHQQKVLQECSRVLKKGGKLVIIEPLKFALFVQLYRLFGSYRKMKPKYATLRMFKEGKKYFSEYQHKEFYFFSSALLPVFWWRRPFLHKIYRHLVKLDTVLVGIFPSLRPGCWVSVVKYIK